MKKKIIITLIVILCVVGLAAVGIFVYKKHSKDTNPVEVISVSDYMGGWYGDYTTNEGTITVEGDQTVYVPGDKVIKEVKVKEGDNVKVGDVLLSYDTTLLKLQLDTQKTQIEVYKTNIQLAKKELEKLKKTTPVEPTESEDVAATAGDALPEGDLGDESEEPTYTKAELDSMISDKEAEIRDTELQLKMAELDLDRQSKNITAGEVISTMNGVVTKVDTSEENIGAGNSVIVVSGNGSYKAIVSINEWKLSEVEIGTMVDLYCYETGTNYTGTISEISTIPSSYNIGGSVTASAYPVTVAIEDGDGLSEGMWVEVTMNGENSMMNGNNDNITLPMCYVRQENGNYYVMKNSNGRLKKQYVKVGKTYYGDSIEIKSGLTANDYIAFPYGKDAVEGKKVKLPDNADMNASDDENVVDDAIAAYDENIVDDMDDMDVMEKE